MHRGDLPTCLGLSRQAGWNQTPADWERFLDLGGAGCFVAEGRDGTPVGTITTCAFGPVGWLSMLLVEASHRGAGLGRALFGRALGHLRDSGVRSMRLDATPLGRPLYESLGFRVDFELARFAGTAPRVATPEAPATVPPRDTAEVAVLDRLVTRADRSRLIERLRRDAPEAARVTRAPSGELTGYALWREGAVAAQIGPCGGGLDLGAALLDAAAAALAGRPVIVDIPLVHRHAVAWAGRHGLRPVRPFWRMTCGDPAAEEVSRLWASSGAELG
jgi:GNAT superfamily N-acetyltransferase